MFQSIKKIAPNLLILMGSLLFSLVIFEVAARIFYSDDSQMIATHQRMFMKHDPLLGWRKIPGFVGDHATSEYNITERMNSKGIRGPEYPYEKPDDEYRILVLGDSFAEGYTVEFNEMFSEILKAKLNDVDGREVSFEVINTGVGGYGTDQELLLFQSEAKQYNPDLTILMFYDNDVWFNIQANPPRGSKPVFKFNDQITLELTNVPVPKLAKTSANKNRPKKSILSTTKTWFIKNSYLYRFIRGRIKNSAFSTKLGIRLGLVDFPSEYLVYEKQADDEVVHAWTMTEALISKLKEEVTAVNSEFLIFYIPNRASVYPDEWRNMKDQYNMDDNGWSINLIQDKLVDICERHQIDCIKTINTLKTKAEEFSKQGQRIYFEIDSHWNRNGHTLAAEILEAHIAKTYLTPDPK